MKISFVTLTKLFGATVAGFFCVSLVLPQASFAQSSGVQNLDPQGSNNTDPFSRSQQDNPFNVFQLMHNAKFGNLNPEFASEKNQQLSDEAAAFRKKQQQLVQQRLQSPAKPGSPLGGPLRIEVPLEVTSPATSRDK
jgi:hypothetical protein